MSITKLSITDFSVLAKCHPVLDVRSPGEYRHAHIPNAYSLPLFSDEERKIVGTAYKQEGRQQAIRIGLEYFGKKMGQIVDEVTALTKIFYGNAVASPGEVTVIVHCWRGGMRSAGIAWLLDLYGFKVYTLAGGYKAYRNWVLQQFEKDYNLQVLGGFTGSDKTGILNQLMQAGEQVIDLESIAAHKGSAFGNLGMPEQPTQEMFENLLAGQLAVYGTESQDVLWLEDESRRIGKLNIPAALFTNMRSKPLVFISIPFNERLQHIISTYGVIDKALLIEAIERIQKRLGGLETQKAIRFLMEDDLSACFSILLHYYDKCYSKAINNRASSKEAIVKVEVKKVDTIPNTQLLLQQIKFIYD